jgi:hypothetical protein
MATSYYLGKFDADFGQRAAAAIPTTTIFTAPAACEIEYLTFIYGTAAGATSTVGVYKDTGTDAPGAGTLVTSAAVNMNTTTNTLMTPTLLTDGTQILAAGDRLSVKVASGTATASADVKIQVRLKQL